MTDRRVRRFNFKADDRVRWIGPEYRGAPSREITYTVANCWYDIRLNHEYVSLVEEGADPLKKEDGWYSHQFKKERLGTPLGANATGLSAFAAHMEYIKTKGVLPPCAFCEKDGAAVLFPLQGKNAEWPPFMWVCGDHLILPTLDPKRPSHKAIV